ncbi:glycosyltransferase family 2 protein [Methanocella conradii]|uniref:glycosyltransferase family 2 protein n=1 Tax=Methanocella conradii TaxID=1175444 RepID=UPI00157CD2B9|nr:glycosyltransferase family 2 protein [Methanocella conradii]
MATTILDSTGRHSENVKSPYNAAELTAGQESKAGLMVAIPAYNEEVAIGSVIARCRKYADSVVVIDDGSSDHTAEVARLVGADVISHGVNKGYGAAIKSCFDAAKSWRASALVIIDGDGQHNPDDIPLLVAELKKAGADIVIGSRFVNGNGKNQRIPAYRKVGMKVLDLATALGSGLKTSDSQSGFRAYSAKAIREIDLEDRGMGIGSEILFKAAEKRLKVSEVPIKARYDLRGTSTENPIIHGFACLGSILKMGSRRKPMLFFGVPGIALLVSCVYITFTSLADATMASSVSIAVMLCMIAGTLGVFTALVLMSIQSTVPSKS